MIVRFLDIGGIVDHYFNFLFLLIKNTCLYLRSTVTIACRMIGMPADLLVTELDEDVLKLCNTYNINEQFLLRMTNMMLIFCWKKCDKQNNTNS